jgi:hypothetical protein
MIIPVAFVVSITNPKISYLDTEQRIIDKKNSTSKNSKWILSTSAIPEVKINTVDRDLIDSEVDNEEYWLKKATECSFCRQFLASPCKAPFKHWSKCVDLAKERGLEFTEVCKDYSAALFSCMEEEREYFELIRAKEREERGDDEDDEEDGNGEEEEEEEEDGDGDRFSTTELDTAGSETK